MLRFATLILAALASLLAAPAAAQSFALVSMPVVYVHKPVVQQVHRGRAGAPADRAGAVYVPAALTIAPTFAAVPTDLPKWRAPTSDTTRFVTAHRPPVSYGAVRYGPFQVIDGSRAALVGETDADSPRWFGALLRDHPGLARIEMIECPGTLDDRANMRLGRMIRAAGLATHVPARGSVRSGAVELFLAGTRRSIADGAEFAVHSWRDAYGREAGDYAADAPENRAYLDYYAEMGMTPHQARAFYDFTNSVPHHRALWLDAQDMRPWIAPGARTRDAAAPNPVSATPPRIAYASLT
ncbi:alpha/beta hydrolase [Qipengyuania sp. MTN3-11]|uniref:alpha/beta hydrolase n=1 Tax=Qipengyuania sp. MTN3-11 TaxID=3056557 RepID=UPI0036F3E35C